MSSFTTTKVQPIYILLTPSRSQSLCPVKWRISVIDASLFSLFRLNSPAHKNRLQQIQKEIEESGTYTHSETELTYGAKLAWRNAYRCIGRIQWSKLQVGRRRWQKFLDFNAKDASRGILSVSIKCRRLVHFFSLN